MLIAAGRDALHHLDSSDHDGYKSLECTDSQLDSTQGDNAYTAHPNPRKTEIFLHKMRVALAIYSLRPGSWRVYCELDCLIVAEKFNVHEQYVRRLWKCRDINSVRRVTKNNRLKRRDFVSDIYVVQVDVHGYFIPVEEESFELNQKDPFRADWHSKMKRAGL